MTDPNREAMIAAKLTAIRKRREKLNLALVMNNAELVAALRDGYRARVDVTKMARLAGISRATAHRLLKSDD